MEPVQSDNTTTTEDAAPSSPFVGQSINKAARVVFATYGSIVILCGVAGNLLLFSALFRRFRQKVHVVDLFIGNFALADTILVGYWLPFMVLDFILGVHPVVNQAHCVVNGIFVFALSMVGSAVSLVNEENKP